MSVHAVAAIRLLMLTGCRKSEILSLQWTDIDFEGRRIEAPRKQDGPARGAAIAAAGEGAGGPAPGSEQPLGNPRPEAGHAHDQPGTTRGGSCGSARGSRTSGFTTAGIPSRQGRWRWARVQFAHVHREFAHAVDQGGVAALIGLRAAKSDLLGLLGEVQGGDSMLADGFLILAVERGVFCP